MTVSDSDRNAIRDAFNSGELKVSSVDTETQEVSDKVVSDILRHSSSHKVIVSLRTCSGRSATFTEDHSIFVLYDGRITPIQAGKVSAGSMIVVVEDGEAKTEEVLSVLEIPDREYTYDLSVPGNENFVLSNGILAHNSYSIGGISLDIEKSSKYQQIKQNAEGRFDKFMDNKTRTVKIIRGLQQSRYGRGLSSSLGGPYSARSGIMTPRNFVGV